MLTRAGLWDEDQLVETARAYIDLYKTNEVCEVPYKEAGSGPVHYIQFAWLNNQWVFWELSCNYFSTCTLLHVTTRYQIPTQSSRDIFVSPREVWQDEFFPDPENDFK